jgi:4-oxalocrotonate tautomerase
MPIVELTLIEGRSHRQKADAVKAVTQALVESLGAPPESVRVIIREIPPEHFAVAGVLKKPPAS